MQSIKMAVKEAHCNNKFWVTSVPEHVFSDDPAVSLKPEFESAFQSFDQSVEFKYIPPLNRVLVIYDEDKTAQAAIEGLKNVQFQGTNLHLHKVKTVTIGERKLSLPEKTKQFLISPPPSPPVGWEPVEEQAPVVDYKLLEALSKLKPVGEPQEVLPKKGRNPSIVVTPMEHEHLLDTGAIGGGKGVISSLPSSAVHTARPPIQND